MNRKGLTIVELLVVAVIVFIFGTMIFAVGYKFFSQQKAWHQLQSSEQELLQFIRSL